MNELLARPIGELIGLSVTLVLLAIFFAGVLSSIIRKNKIGFSFKGLNVKSSEDDLDGNGKGHSHCIRSRDFTLVSKVSFLAAKEMFQVERFDTIAEQMSYTEQAIAEMRKEMRSKYLVILKEAKGMDTPDGLLATHEAGDYLVILRVLTSELKDALRSIFQENHLADMTDIEFEDYIQRRVAYLNDMVTELLDDIYPRDVVPSRERLFAANREISREIDDLFESTLRRGRFIAIEKRNIAKKIEEDLDTEVGKIVE